MTDCFGLRDRVVVVVGAGGIGLAATEAFVGEGAKVVLVDKDRGRLETTEAKLGLDACGGGVRQVDVRDSDACRSLIQSVCDQLGRIDILLHSVGINQRQPVLDIDETLWDDIIGVNLSSAFWIGKAAGKVMQANGFGRIVYLSSVSGLLAHENHAPYAASKGGLNQLLRVMAREWASHGVTVNGVAPGYMETPLTESYLDQPGVRKKLTDLVPSGRLGTVDDVVGPILFLSSPHASFVTGHILYVDGGRTLV